MSNLHRYLIRDLPRLETDQRATATRRARLRHSLRRLQGIPTPLRILLVVALLEAFAWSLATAPWQGPDENAHFNYAQYLAETGHKPAFTSGTSPVSQEMGSALGSLNLWQLVGVRGARPSWSKLDVQQWHDTEKKLRAADRKNGSGPNALAKNPPLYYVYEAVPYRIAYDAPVLTRLWLMRLATALLFPLMVALSWLLAAELFTRTLARFVAAGVVALHPVLAFMAGVVNSDLLLSTVWTAFILLSVRLVLRGPSLRRVAGVLALAAVGVLTHGRGVPLVPLAFFALALSWWRHRPPVRRAAIWAGAGAGILALGVGIYKLVLNANGGGRLYGGELQIGHFHIGQFLNFVWQFYLPKLPGMPPRVGPAYGWRQMFIDRYFSSFGSLEVTFEPNILRLIQILAFASLVFMVVQLFRQRHAVGRVWDVFVLLAAITAVAMLFLHVVSYRAVVDGGQDPIIVGRYLLPLTAIFGLAVAFVVNSLGRRLAPYAAAFVLALGVLLQLGGLGLTLDRFYG